MFHPVFVQADDVSPIEAKLDRIYWSSLLGGRMMPGLGLAAIRMTAASERPFPALVKEELITAVATEVSHRGQFRRRP